MSQYNITHTPKPATTCQCFECVKPRYYFSLDDLTPKEVSDLDDVIFEFMDFKETMGCTPVEKEIIWVNKILQ